jgi:hypothetical protein
MARPIDDAARAPGFGLRGKKVALPGCRAYCDDSLLLGLRSTKAYQRELLAVNAKVNWMSETAPHRGVLRDVRSGAASVAVAQRAETLLTEVGALLHPYISPICHWQNAGLYVFCWLWVWPILAVLAACAGSRSYYDTEKVQHTRIEDRGPRRKW